MPRAEIERKVCDIVQRVVGPPKDCAATPEKNLVTDLGADSIDALEIWMELEEEFDLDVNQNDLRDDVTLKEIVDFVEAQLAR